MIKYSQQLSLGSVLALSFYIAPACAAFGIQTEAAPYGNGQSRAFQQAIQGGSPVPEKDIAEFEKMLPLQEEGHFYGRFRLNYSNVAFDQLKNKSQGDDSIGVLTKKSLVDHQGGFEAALGYVFAPSLRGDIEYLASKNLTYKANPVLNGTPTLKALNAQIKTHVLLVNAYYDFQGFDSLKPYLTAGIGPSYNTVQTNLTPDMGQTVSNSQRALRVAWSGGAGVRMQISPRWYADASYRYINLGSGLRITGDQGFKILGNASKNAFSLGVNYLF